MSKLVELVKSVIESVNNRQHREDLKRFAEIEYKHDSTFVYYTLISQDTKNIDLDEVLR
jgi:hypothetical protein